MQTEMTRCIHCTRCVRFLEEIAGTSEMGGSGRGDRLEIGTCVQNSIDSELSGNIIDLCPVGALTNKPFRFAARAWELVAKPSWRRTMASVPVSTITSGVENSAQRSARK